jgi:hypothetical protein
MSRSGQELRVKQGERLIMFSVANARTQSSTGLFVRRVAGEDTLIAGSMEGGWTRAMSRRAAQSLWADLTRLLFPDKSHQIISLVATAASLPPVGDAASHLTTHAALVQTDDGSLDIVGWAGTMSWRVHLNHHEIHALWTELDLALYPTGWWSNGGANQS